MTLYRDDAFDQETVLITGATGGIGSSIAETLAEMGASLLLTGRRQDVLEDLQQTTTEHDSSGTVHIQTADITDKADRETLVEAATQIEDGVTMLVNSAGIGSRRTEFENLSQEQLTEILNINYTSTVLLTQAIYRLLRSNGRGSIVNIASLSGLRGTYQSIPYCSSKFALIGFTQSLALEAIEHNIRVNAVCPGWVDTAMGREGIKSKAKASDRSFEEQLEHEQNNLPSGRITSPEEVANTVAFLLSDTAENIVGESLKISGGSVLR